MACIDDGLLLLHALFVVTVIFYSGMKQRWPQVFDLAAGHSRNEFGQRCRRQDVVDGSPGGSGRRHKPAAPGRRNVGQRRVDVRTMMTPAPPSRRRCRQTVRAPIWWLRSRCDKGSGRAGERCRLGEQRGDGQALAFAARQGVDLRVLHAGQAHRAQGAAGQFGIARRFPVPAAEVRVAAGEGRFQHCRRTDRSGTDPARPRRSAIFAADAAGRRPRPEQHGTTGRLAQAGQGGQQGHCPPVAAEDGQALAARHAEVEAVDDGRADADAQLAGFDQRPWRSFRLPRQQEERPARRSAPSARRPAAAAGRSRCGPAWSASTSSAAGRPPNRQEQALVVADGQPHQVGHDHPIEPAVVPPPAVSQRASRKNGVAQATDSDAERLGLHHAARQQVQFAGEGHSQRSQRHDQDRGGHHWRRLGRGRPSARTACRAACSGAMASISANQRIPAAGGDDDAGEQQRVCVQLPSPCARPKTMNIAPSAPRKPGRRCRAAGEADQDGEHGPDPAPPEMPRT